MVKEYTSFVAKTVEAEEVVLEAIVFDKVDKYTEMIWLDWGIVAI